MARLDQRDPNIQWIELTDFSLGIHSNNQLAAGVQVTAPNVAYASPTNTYRCIALPTGGLGPLPRLRDSFSLTTNPDAAENPTYQVAGFGTQGRVLNSPATSSTVQFAAIHVVLYYEYGGTPDARLKWLRQRHFDDTPSTETIITRTATGDSGPYFAYLLKTRVNPTTPTDPGTPVIVCVANRVANNDMQISRAFPDPASATTNSTVEIGTETDDYIIAAAHQGRVILGKWQGYDQGPDATLATNENLVWTATNDNTLSSSTPAVFVPEVDQFITEMASMSANQLLVIKWYGGGYVLQGDLDDVTVVRLPNLPCPDGADFVRGCNTSRGYVYSAGPAGMYLWNGGDGATPISRQLDGDFAIGSNILRGANGQCDRWIDRVLVPQNWVWDTTMESWWRIEDIDEVNIRFWSTLANAGYAYGAEATFTDAAGDFMHEFRYDDLAYSWSWQSHPLWVSRDRRLEVRQGVIALQGHGSVTVTISNDEGDEISTQTFEIDTDVIRNYRWDIARDSENLVIRIEAEGHTSGGPATSEAPLVHRLFLAYKTAQSLANANQ